MTARVPPGVSNLDYFLQELELVLAGVICPSLFTENPRRGVLGSRLARSSDGLGNTNGLEMGQMTQGKMRHSEDARGPFRLLLLLP